MLKRLQIFIPLFVLICLAAGIGFVGGLVLFQSSERIDFVGSMRAETGWIVQPEAGWGRPTVAGTPIIADVAKAIIPLPRMPEEDIVLDVERAAGAFHSSVWGDIDIYVNDELVGSWVSRSQYLKRVVVLRSIASRGKHLSVALKIKGASSDVVISMIAVRELSALRGSLGYVDSCVDGTVSGWAKAGDAPAPVQVLRNGAVARQIMPSVERADLQSAGHPSNAGFVFSLSQLLMNPDDKFELILPSGRGLSASSAFSANSRNCTMLLLGGR